MLTHACDTYKDSCHSFRNKSISHSPKNIYRWKWSYYRTTLEFIQMHECMSVCMCVCVFVSNFGASIKVSYLLLLTQTPIDPAQQGLYMMPWRILYWCNYGIILSIFFSFLIKMKGSGKDRTKWLTLSLNTAN